MRSSQGVRRIRRGGRNVVLVMVVGATAVLAVPASAQSPIPEPAAHLVASGSAAPAIPSGLAALKASFAAAICDPLLSAADVSAELTLGVTATINTGVRQAPLIASPGFIQLFCTWQIDGGSIALHVADQSWDGKGKPKAKDHLIAQLLDHHALPGNDQARGAGRCRLHGAGQPRQPSVAEGGGWAVYVKHGAETADRELKLSGDIDEAVLQTLAGPGCVGCDAG